MNRRQLMVYGGIGGVCCLAKRAEGADAELRQLLVDIDAVLLAALGWDVPKALKKEIETLRGRIAHQLAQ